METGPRKTAASRSKTKRTENMTTRASGMRPDLPAEGRDPLVLRGGQDQLLPALSMRFTARRCGSPGGYTTRYEMLALARHWRSRILDIELEWFYFQQTGSSEIRVGPYANRRLRRIADVIGEAAVEEVVTEVEEEQRRRMGEEHWRIFTEGTQEEKRRDSRRGIQEDGRCGGK